MPNIDANKINDVLASTSSPDKVKRLNAFSIMEAIMKECEQVEIPVNHRFFGDMYMREITLKKDTLLTGRIHKFDHFDIMLSGDITVSTTDGQVKRLTGLNIFDGKAGKKRAGYVHEDTHWITIHASEERDPESMLEWLTVETFEELEWFNNALNQNDYFLMVSEMNMTEEEIQIQVQNEEDQIIFDLGYEHLKILPSEIHGEGLFSDNEINKGDIIAPARITGMRTPAGRYTNHAFSPNSEMKVETNGEVYLVALKAIESNEEITINYRNVIDHRELRGDLCLP